MATAKVRRKKTRMACDTCKLKSCLFYQSSKEKNLTRNNRHREKGFICKENTHGTTRVPRTKEHVYVCRCRCECECECGRANDGECSAEQKKALEMDCSQSMGILSEIGFWNGLLISRLLTLSMVHKNIHYQPPRLHTNHFIESSMFFSAFDRERENNIHYTYQNIKIKLKIQNQRQF